MLAVIAAVLFAIGFILHVAGAALGRMDGLAWLLAGAFFAALAMMWPGWWRPGPPPP